MPQLRLLALLQQLAPALPLLSMASHCGLSTAQDDGSFAMPSLLSTLQPSNARFMCAPLHMTTGATLVMPSIPSSPSPCMPSKGACRCCLAGISPAAPAWRPGRAACLGRAACRVGRATLVPCPPQQHMSPAQPARGTGPVGAGKTSKPVLSRFAPPLHQAPAGVGRSSQTPATHLGARVDHHHQRPACRLRSLRARSCRSKCRSHGCRRLLRGGMVRGMLLRTPLQEVWLSGIVHLACAGIMHAAGWYKEAVCQCVRYMCAVHAVRLVGLPVLHQDRLRKAGS